MADENNAGYVSLGVKLDDKEFLRQIGTLAQDISKVMQKSLNVKAPKIDMRDVTSDIRSVGKEITKSLDGIGDMLYEQFSKGVQEGAVEGAVKASSAMTQFKMPKIKIDLDEGHLREQIRIYGKLWEAYDNQRIAQAQKVKRMTRELSQTLPGAGREKMAIDLAKEQKRLVDIQLAASQADQQVVALERALQQISQPKPNPAAHAMKDIAQSAGAQAQVVVRQTTAQVKQMGTVGRNAGHEIRRSFDGAGKATSKLGGAMKKTLRIGLAFMGVRSIYYGIRRAVNSVMQSFQRMAAQNRGFAKTMNSLTAATDTLKGSFAAMVAPLVEALAPAIKTVVDWLTKAFNALAIFFGALTGKKTVMIAVGSTKKFTAATGKATAANEKLKRSLASFDELEILSTKNTAVGSGGLGGVGADAGQQFKEVSTQVGGLMGEIIKKIRGFVQKIKDFWDKEIRPLWGKIESTAREVWGDLEKFWNKKGGVIKKIFGDRWKYISEKFSNVLDNIRNIFGLFVNIFTGDWEGAWKNVKGIASGIWKNLEIEFNNSLNNIENLLGLFGIDVSGIVGGLKRSIGGLTTFLSGVFTGDWRKAWNGVKDIFGGIWDSVKRALGLFGIDVDEVVNGIKRSFNGVLEFITGVFTGNWESAWTGVKNIFGGIFDSLKGIFITPINWIIDRLNDFIRQVNKIKIPDWVPGIGGYGINIGTIKRIGENYVSTATFFKTLGSHINRIVGAASKKRNNAIATPHARGGFVQQPSLAYVGERRKKEAIIPLEQNLGWADIMADRLSERMGGRSGETNVTVPIYLGTDTLIATIEFAIDREGRVRNKPVFA